MLVDNHVSLDFDGRETSLAACGAMISLVLLNIDSVVHQSVASAAVEAGSIILLDVGLP